jgi:dienelactone hydrolase
MGKQGKRRRIRQELFGRAARYMSRHTDIESVELQSRTNETAESVLIVRGRHQIGNSRVNAVGFCIGNDADDGDGDEE